MHNIADIIYEILFQIADYLHGKCTDHVSDEIDRLGREAKASREASQLIDGWRAKNFVVSVDSQQRPRNYKTRSPRGLSLRTQSTDTSTAESPGDAA